MTYATQESVAATLTQGEMGTEQARAGFTRLGLVPVPDDMAGASLELQTEDGVVVVGWMTRRFMRGAPTFWTWDRAPDDMHPRCIAPIAWRAAEGAR